MSVTMIDSDKEILRLVAMTHYNKEMFTQLASWLVESINCRACLYSGYPCDSETLWNEDFLWKTVLLQL